MRSRRSPVSTTSPRPFSPLRNRDEAQTLSARPLHPGRAGGARPPLADRPPARPGAAVPGDRRARAHEHSNRHACRSVAAPRRRRLHARARAHLLGGPHERGRPPPRRRPLEGADGAPRARAARRRRAPLRGRRARAARPLRRTRRSTSCSSGRTTSPSTCRTASFTRGSPARTSSSRRRPDVVQLAELGFARCTLEAAVPNGAPQQALADLAGLRVATAYPVSTRVALARARRRGRARHDFRLGRGRATARALGRRRRPRLDRLDGERERAAADRPPALVGGGADREPDRAGRRSTRAARTARS